HAKAAIPGDGERPGSPLFPSNCGREKGSAGRFSPRRGQGGVPGGGSGSGHSPLSVGKSGREMRGPITCADDPLLTQMPPRKLPNSAVQRGLFVHPVGVVSFRRAQERGLTSPPDSK